MREESFNLVAAKLEAAKQQHIDYLNKALFSAELWGRVTPLTRRERIRLKARRVQAYFVTLWRALRGDDPFNYDEY